jgi:hypothetical protein
MGENLTTHYRRPPSLAGNFSNSAGSTSNSFLMPYKSSMILFGPSVGLTASTPRRDLLLNVIR